MKLLHDLTGAERDVLRCLFFRGPTWDGDVPSKTGRNDLVDAGYAEHRDGWAWLTAAGIQLALGAGLDREKEEWQRERAKARDEAIDDLRSKLIAAQKSHQETLRAVAIVEVTLQSLVKNGHSRVNAADLAKILRDIIRRAQHSLAQTSGNYLPLASRDYLFPDVTVRCPVRPVSIDENGLPDWSQFAAKAKPDTEQP